MRRIRAVRRRWSRGRHVTTAASSGRGGSSDRSSFRPPVTSSSVARSSHASDEHGSVSTRLHPSLRRNRTGRHWHLWFLP